MSEKRIWEHTRAEETFDCLQRRVHLWLLYSRSIVCHPGPSAIPGRHAAVSCSSGPWTMDEASAQAIRTTRWPSRTWSRPVPGCRAAGSLCADMLREHELSYTQAVPAHIRCHCLSTDVGTGRPLLAQEKRHAQALCSHTPRGDKDLVASLRSRLPGRHAATSGCFSLARLASRYDVLYQHWWAASSTPRPCSRYPSWTSL